MWWIFFFFIVGILVGFYFNNKFFLVFSEQAVNWTVYFLLLLLGVNTGSNKELIRDFLSIGFESFLLSIGALTGSFLLAFLWERFFCTKKRIKEKELGNDKTEKLSITGSIYVAGFFITGLLIGIFTGQLTGLLSNSRLINITLYFLLFFVGSSIGSDREVLKNLKGMSWNFLIFPVITVLGTLAGSFLISFFMKNINYANAMAVGSGFGYYSLSSVIIAGLNGDRLATVALVANIIREIVTLLFAPFIFRFFGKFALVSSGGATSMDTTLPVIVKFAGKEMAILSVYHGIVLTVLVPFLVTFFAANPAFF